MNTVIYRLLLRIYPADFRRRWEEAMVYTFELQLANSWLEAWACALAELTLTWSPAHGRALTSLYAHLIARLSG